jgi:hypothetical protein
LSQLPYVPVQVTEHWLLLHDATPLVELQRLPHVPQFNGSTVKRASHPSENLPLQSAKPVLHPALALAVSTLHNALTHLPSGPLATTQEFRHVLQLLGSVLSVASHPFFVSPSQLP